MTKSFTNPRILVIDGGIEYKKGESKTTIEVQDSEKFSQFLAEEENQVKAWVEKIAVLKPDVVAVTKGVSEYAAFLLFQSKITAFRRCKKTDLSRLCLASGAKMASLDSPLEESMIGTKCGQFCLIKHGIEYFAYFTKCSEPKACTITVAGQMKDFKTEIIRNIQDALFIARSTIKDPLVIPGAGATDLMLSMKIQEDLANSKIADPIEQKILAAMAKCFELFPQTLLENAGVSDVARKLLQIKVQMKSNSGSKTSIGIDGHTGVPKKE